MHTTMMYLCLQAWVAAARWRGPEMVICQGRRWPVIYWTLSHPVSTTPTLRAAGQTTQVSCAIISAQYIYNIYTIYLQYLHNISRISTHYIYNIYTIYLQYLHNISTISTDYLVSAVTDPSPPLSLPHIDPYHSTNMTALAGATTRLNCRVYR